MIRTVNLPWGVNHPDVKYWGSKKLHVYNGAILPESLQRFASQPYSYERWVEDEINGMVLPPERSSVKFEPREHQVAGAKAIFNAHKAGWRGFIESDKTGLGKTLSTLTGICAVAKKQGFQSKKRGKLLIVCPKGAIPEWRKTLNAYPLASALMRVLVINYHQLNKLLEKPAGVRVSSKKKSRDRQIARDGKPTVDWDYVIFDESHYLKNYPKSTMSLAAVSVASLDKQYSKGGNAPFTIFCTATPGSTPLNMSVMAGVLAPLLSSSEKAKTITPKTWGVFLEKIGFHVKKGKKGYNWVAIPGFGKNSKDPKERRKYRQALAEATEKQREDTKRIGKALKKPGAPFIMRKPTDIAGWPEQQLIPMPIELDSKQVPVYESAWQRFRAWLQLPASKQDSKSALVENLRFRQKASLLKVPHVAEHVEAFVESGNQVYVSVEFLETVDEFKKHFDKKGITTAEITGRMDKYRESERLRFQKGEAKVVLCNVIEALSLHSGESPLSDGSTATDAPRITVIHDMRQNDLDTNQSLGRAHRDGTNSLTYFPYLTGTVEEKVNERYVIKRSNMERSLGEDEDSVSAIQSIFENEAAKNSDR